MSRKLVVGFGHMFLLVLGLSVWGGCQDKRRHLLAFLGNNLYIDPGESTIMGLKTYGCDVRRLQADMKKHFTTNNLEELACERNCLLMLKSHEETLHIRELRKSYRSWARKDFDFFFQSVNVVENSKKDDFPQSSYVLLFVHETVTGIWYTIGIDPHDRNALSTIGSVGERYLLYNRDWLCRNFIGNISFSQGLFDEERFDAAFALCMESLNAAILYSSQEEIAALRLRSEYPILKLCWRTPNCLIFVPQGFGIIEQCLTEKWRFVKKDS